jgi:hypothetical protein
MVHEVEYFPSMHIVLGSIPSTAKTKQNKTKQSKNQNTLGYISHRYWAVL